MKKLFCKYIKATAALLLAVCVVFGSVSVITALSADTNLITNGDFKLYDSGTNKFDGWSYYGGNNEPNYLSRANGRTDTNALLSVNTVDSTICSASQSFTVEAGKDYRVIAYIKAGSSDDIKFNCPSWAKGAYLQVGATGMTAVKSTAVRAGQRWTRVSFIVTDADIPDDITTLKLTLEMEYIRGLIYLDDVSVKEYDGTELEPEVLEDLYNTDFEDASSSIIEDWNTNIPRPDRATILPTSDANEVYSGSKAVKFASTNRDDVINISQKINNIDNTKRYALTCYIKTDALDVAYQGGGVKLMVLYKDIGSQEVKITSKALTTTTEWTQHKLYFQIPEGATDVTARLMLDCVKGNVFFDKVSLSVIGNAIVVQPEKITNAGFEEYYDGEFPEWSFYNGGNANNSVSQAEGRNGYAAVLTDTDTDHIAYFSQTVTIDPEKDYRISLYVKAQSTDGLDVYVPSWGGAYIKASAGDSYAVESEKIMAAGRYKRLSVIVKGSELPQNTTSIKISFIMQYLRGTFYLDDASIVEYTGQPEEPEVYEDLYNTSFEIWNDNSPEDWTKSLPNSTVTGTSANVAYEGTKSFKFTSDNRDNVANVNQAINNIDTAYRYCLKAYTKAEGKPEIAYQGGGIKIRVTYKDSEKNTVTISSEALREADDWTAVKLYFQIPEGATDVRAVLMIDCLKGTVYYDNVTVEKIGNAIATEKGSFANADFEIFHDGEFPEWKFSSGGNSKNSITQTNARTGKGAFIRVGSSDHVATLSQSVEFDRTKDYKITFYVRPTSDETTAIHFYDWSSIYLQLKAGDFVLTSEKVVSPSRYRKLTLILNGEDLPESTSTANISLMCSYLRGVVYIDDASIEEYNGEPLEPDVFDDLYNLSFEEGAGNHFDDWNKSIPNDTITITPSSDAYDGSRSVLFTSSNRNNVFSINQTINNWSPAYRYRITAYAKTLIEPNVAYDGGGIKLRVSYTDKDGNTQNLSSAGKRELENWTRLYIDYQIPEGAKNVRLVIMADCLVGKVLFDKVGIEKIGNAVEMPVQDPLNKAPNFSFENGQDGAFPGWYWWTQSEEIICETGEPRSGAQSAKMVSTVKTSNSMLSVDTSELDTTKWYQFSVWAKTKNIEPLVAGDGGVRIKMEFKKAGGNSTLRSYFSKYLVGDNDWTLLTVIGKFPADCKRVIFGISFTRASGEAWFDDVDIREIEYIDNNLIRNGNFDEFNDEGDLLHWEKETDDWSYASFMADESTAQVENAGYATSYYYQELTLDHRLKYVLAGSLKSSYMVSDGGGAAVLVEYVDVYGNTIKTVRCTDFISEASEGWTEFCTNLAFPEGCHTLRVLLANVNGVGEASFKSFSLYAEEDYMGEATAAEGTSIKNLKAPASAVVKYVKPEEKGSALPFVAVTGAVVVVLAFVGAAVFLIVRKRKKANKI